jgi:hypothetical protein
LNVYDGKRFADTAWVAETGADFPWGKNDKKNTDSIFMMTIRNPPPPPPHSALNPLRPLAFPKWKQDKKCKTYIKARGCFERRRKQKERVPNLCRPKC